MVEVANAGELADIIKQHDLEIRRLETQIARQDHILSTGRFEDYGQSTNFEAESPGGSRSLSPVGGIPAFDRLGEAGVTRGLDLENSALEALDAFSFPGFGGAHNEPETSDAKKTSAGKTVGHRKKKITQTTSWFLNLID